MQSGADRQSSYNHRRTGPQAIFVPIIAEEQVLKQYFRSVSLMGSSASKYMKAMVEMYLFFSRNISVFGCKFAHTCKI